MSGSYGSAYTQGLQQYTGKEKVVQSVIKQALLRLLVESYSQPGTVQPSRAYSATPLTSRSPPTILPTPTSLHGSRQSRKERRSVRNYGTVLALSLQ